MPIGVVITATEPLSELCECGKILARELHYALGEESPAFFLDPSPSGAGYHLSVHVVPDVALRDAQAVFCVCV